MKIGFIGLGLMGTPMCLNIIRKLNTQVYVFDLNKDALNEVEQSGAIICNSTIEVVNKSDLIITMLPKNEHVTSVYNEVLTCNVNNKIFLDMSTISPKVSVNIANKIKLNGGQFLDCPVVKSRPAAIKGELGIYVGGDKDTFKNIEYILQCMGNNILYLGENGKGLVMKICHNMLVGQIQNGVNEMLSLAAKSAAIDPLLFSKAISYGGGQNFYLDSKAPLINEVDFTTMFSVENMHKDVHLAKLLAEEYELNLPGINNVVNVYDEAMKLNLNHEDFSATIKLFDERYND